MARIFFDARHITKAGIGVYIGEVLEKLVNSNIEICLITNNKQHIAKYVGRKNVTYLKAPKMFSLMEQVWFLAKIHLFYNKVYVSPYLNFPILFKIKLLFIVHDLIWLLHPEFASGKIGYLYFKIFMLCGIKKASNIIAISHNTKNDILRFSKESGEKIVVLYNGLNSSEFANISPAETDLSYFIYVGNWKPWKNVPVLLKAFSNFLNKKSNDEDVKLVLCGDNQTNMSDDIEAIISKDEKLRKHVIITGKIDRIDLLRWIKKAIALIQPSMYEGFGMAVVEGLALDTPVICSDIPVFKEIVGENVKYFQSGNADDLADKMLERYSSGVLNSTSHTDKEKLFAKYNWQSIADFIVRVSAQN